MGDNDGMYWDDEDQQWYSYPVEKDCLFIFDWDNTLLPKKALKAYGVKNCRIPESLKPYLRYLGSRVLRVLSRAVDIGEAMIITNGTEEWVRRSASRCFPDVLAFMDQNDVEIVSARDRYRAGYRGQKQVWKDKTFHDEVEEYIEDLTPTAESFSLVSIGDGEYERLAVLKLTSIMPQECVKAVELETLDDLDDFKEQIDKVYNILDSSKNSAEHLDLDISTRRRSRD